MLHLFMDPKLGSYSQAAAEVQQEPAGPLPQAFIDIDQAFYAAAQAGDSQLVTHLLQSHSQLSIGSTLRTALHAAALNGHQQVVSALLSHGAAVNAADALGHTALHLAARGGHECVLSVLLAARADTQAVRRETGCTPLHLAALRGHAGALRLLLQAGASVHASNKLGTRPLHLAAEGGHAAAVSHLLAAGASASTQDAQGLTPIHKAAAAGHEAVVKLLLQHQPLPSPELQVAVCFADIFGHIRVLARLLMQLSQQDNKAAESVLPQLTSDPRTSQRLLMAMLAAWNADTAESTAAAEGLAREHRHQAEVRSGLQQMVIGLLAGQAAETRSQQ
jgi:ankyrin repeat protein